MTVTVAERAQRDVDADTGAPGVRNRIMETAELMDRRGYGVAVADFARLLYGGTLPPAAVAAALEGMSEFGVSEGLVIRRDRRGEERAMRSRQFTHFVHGPEAERLAQDFAARLVSSCPLVRSVSLTGSMASGGFHPGDDVDVNLVAAPGAKYTVYLWALALAAVTSLRNLGKETDEMSALPFLPKIICVNVVWEEGQLRPLARQDKWIAYELLMHRPVLGAAAWRKVLSENRWMEEHFPQVFETGFVGEDSEGARRLAAARRRGRAFFNFLERHRRALSAVENCSRFAVIAIHRLVSLSRTRKPEARDREAFVNLVKRPYSVYDIPGREPAVPAEALRPRAPDPAMPR